MFVSSKYAYSNQLGLIAHLNTNNIAKLEKLFLNNRNKYRNLMKIYLIT